jgi:hypothetical protein
MYVVLTVLVGRSSQNALELASLAEICKMMLLAILMMMSAASVSRVVCVPQDSMKTQMECVLIWTAAHAMIPLIHMSHTRNQDQKQLMSAETAHVSMVFGSWILTSQTAVNAHLGRCIVIILCCVETHVKPTWHHTCVTVTLLSLGAIVLMGKF